MVLRICFQDCFAFIVVRDTCAAATTAAYGAETEATDDGIPIAACPDVAARRMP